MRTLKFNRREVISLACGLLLAGCNPKQEPGDSPKTASNGVQPMSSKKDSWQRIEAWLKENAPKILASLNPPATEDQLRAAEKAIGIPLPPEFQALYRTHNGMQSKTNLGSLFCGMQFLSLDEALQERDANSNLKGVAPLPVRAADPGINTLDMHNPKWIPLARSGECLLRIDLDPAPNGTLGQVIFTDHADDTVILMNKSIDGFVAQFASDLEDGRYLLNKDALADGDHFLDPIPEIDVSNWSISPKWKHLVR